MTIITIFDTPKYFIPNYCPAVKIRIGRILEYFSPSIFLLIIGNSKKGNVSKDVQK